VDGVVLEDEEVVVLGDGVVVKMAKVDGVDEGMIAAAVRIESHVNSSRKF
jgi:hypothetical protein